MRNNSGPGSGSSPFEKSNLGMTNKQGAPMQPGASYKALYGQPTTGSNGQILYQNGSIVNHHQANFAPPPTNSVRSTGMYDRNASTLQTNAVSQINYVQPPISTDGIDIFALPNGEPKRS